MKKYAIYLRVSTQKQGKSRLGLDAQKRMCEEFVTQEKGEIVRNGLCFSWKIINGHVEQEIKVSYATGWRDGKDKLQCFTEMCEGRYVAVL